MAKFIVRRFLANFRSKKRCGEQSGTWTSVQVKQCEQPSLVKQQSRHKRGHEQSVDWSKA